MLKLLANAGAGWYNTENRCYLRRCRMNNHDPYDFCRRYMTEDEYILWKGHPEKGNIFTGREAVMLPFSIVWLSFAVYWEITALRSGSNWFMVLWGLPFVAIGAYLLIGRFIMTAYLRTRTFYVITNRKLMIRKGSRIQIHDGRNLPPMNLVIHKNGNGTILFTQNVYTSKGSRSSTALAIENIADVAQAQNAVDRMERQVGN